MIIVTGTKRSGTSMWMQILEGAGFPVIGSAFPGKWKDNIGAANPDGFYESMLRSGVYFATNPRPGTSHYLFSEQVTNHAVKIFIPGLVRTERAFIGRVVATLRHWREYEKSVQRLYALEREAFEQQGREYRRLTMTPALEWWWENYTLVRDVATRRYAIHFQSYDGLLADPEKVIADTLKWIGRGDAAAAAARVKRQNRNFVRPESDSVEPDVATVFDEFYDAIDRRAGLSPAFLAKMDETYTKLYPRISAELRNIQNDRSLARAQRRARAEGALSAREMSTLSLESALDDLDAPAELEGATEEDE